MREFKTNGRLSIVFFPLLLAGVLFWSLWPRHLAEEVSAPVTAAVGQGTNAPGSKARHSLPPPELIPEIIRSMTGERQRQREQAAERSLNEWRTPIEFYGKVVDENGQPVAGVAVSFSCNDLSAAGTSFYQTTSDAQGLFSITGIKGKLLAVELNKSGFYTSQRDTRHFYYAGQNENFVPNASQPVLFHLRKHGQAEPLHITPGRVKIPLGGTPLDIDLINGQPVTEGGHLRLICHSQPDSSRRDYDWSLRFIVPGGGIQDTEEEFPFLAPEDGYRPELEIAMRASEPQTWAKMVRRSFFIRLPDGRHGRMSIFFVAYNGVLRFDAAVNPSGSRNLEYSEAVQP